MRPRKSKRKPARKPAKRIAKKPVLKDGKCSSHPKYAAKRAPTSDCPVCLKVWRLKLPSESDLKKLKLPKSEEEIGAQNSTVRELIRGYRRGLQEKLRDAARTGQDVFDPKSPLSEVLKPEGKVRVETAVQQQFKKQDCIDLLRGMAATNPNKVITRNHFRNWSGINESTWNQFCGTFHEFKRQAKVVLSRQQHWLERNIAQHASQDHYQDLDEQRWSYGEKYTRPNNRRIQTYVCATDFHDFHCDPFCYRVFLNHICRVQPDKILLLGDVFDLPEFGKYSNDPRVWDVVGRIKWVHKLLEDIREECPDAELIFFEGNHEFRLARHMCDGTQALKVVLNELHGMDLEHLFMLDKYEVRYIAKGTLKAFTKKDIQTEVSKNFEVFHSCFIAGHFPEFKKQAMWGVSGHHHKHEILSSGENSFYGYWEFHQLGAMCVRDATYTNGKCWSNGFATVTIDLEQTDETQLCPQVALEYHSIKDFACLAGEYYFRRPDEAVPR